MSDDNKIIIAVDAMGGDYAPEEQIKGAVQAVQAEQDLIVKLFGDEQRLRSELSSYTYDQDRIVTDRIHQIQNKRITDNSHGEQIQDLVEDQDVAFFRHQNLFGEIHPVSDVKLLFLLLMGRQFAVIAVEFFKRKELDLRLQFFKEIRL